MTPPAAPDPNALKDGEARLDAEVASLERRLEEAITGWAARLESEIRAPLTTAVREAREAHAVLLAEAGFAESAAPTDPSWPRLRAYREGVLTRVLTPLHDTLRSLKPAGAAAREWDALSEAVEEAAAALPAELIRPEPSDLYATGPDDGLGRRIRKGAVRTGRMFSALGRRGEVRAQRVPLRALGMEILRAESLPGAPEALEATRLDHARCVALLERGIGWWVRGWFPLEDGRRSVETHFPSDVAARLEELRDALAPLLEERAEANAAPEDSEADESASDTSPTAPATEEPAEDLAADASASASPASVALALHAALAAAADALGQPATVEEPVRDGFERLARRFADAVRHAGTRMGYTPSGSERKRLSRLRVRRERRSAQWKAWESAAQERLRLALRVTGFRTALDAELDRLYAESSEHFLGHLAGTLRAGRQGLDDLRVRAADPAGVLLTSTDPSEVAAEVAALLEEATEVLRTRVTAPMDPSSTRPPLSETADRAAERIADRARELPGPVAVHPLRDPPPPVGPDETTRQVDLREIVQQSLDVLRLEAFRAAATPILTALEESAAACAEVPEVVTYNLSAARDELVGEEVEDPALVLEDARNLTLEGLERTADQLELILADVFEPWDAFAERAHAVLLEAMLLMHERLVMEKAVQEQLRDFRTLLAGWVRQVDRRAQDAWANARRVGRRIGRRSWIRLLRIVRLGRSAVGAERVAQGETERAHDVFRNIPVLVDSLPLVYRRLFSFRPVTDPGLLVGRGAELEWVTGRYTAWREGLRTPSMLVGPATVGATSLLNVVEAAVLAEASTVRLSLADCDRCEEALASAIGEALRDGGVLRPEETAGTLDELARLLLDLPPTRTEGPFAVLVEHFAHLLLRVPEGMELAAAFLDFQARTSPVVFWLSAASDPTWQLFRKTEPRSAELVNVGRVPRLDRDDVEEVIMVRHRRSGVPVEFVAPQEASPILRRKLKRAHGEYERQEVLQTEYFDRLYRVSQGNVIMAILLWLKSLDFETRAGWMRVTPPRAVLGSLVEELTLDQAFTLKALLEHGSLTLEECATVFAVDTEEAYQSLEALRGRMLLDRMDMQGALPRPVRRVESGVAYRIPPILTDIVANQLRKHHILH